MTDDVEIPSSYHDLFENLPTGYVATVRTDGSLSVHPVSPVRDGRLVRFSTRKDRVKYRNLLADRRVAICVPERGDPNRYIEIRGHAEVEDDTDRAFINRIAKIYMGADSYDGDPEGAERVVVTIHPEQVWAPDRPFKNPALRADHTP